ncbi:MAG: type II toxin-antitoxin system HicA family toxin [Patescibacteria group bacterium]|mgnify:CR=1 FL=1
MPRITPIHYKKLVKIFEYLDFHLDRQEGDHLVFVKNGIKRPIVIPMYKDVPIFIIKNNLDSAGISRSEYLKISAIV